MATRATAKRGTACPGPSRIRRVHRASAPEWGKRGHVMASSTERGKGRLAALGGIVGLGGILVCSLSMIAVAVGLLSAGGTVAAQGSMASMGSEHHSGSAHTSSGHQGGTGQGGMAGMGSNEHGGAAANADSGHHGGAGSGTAHAPGWLDIVLRWGPEILVVSVLLIVISAALRRRSAALPAIGGGLVLYVGMYAQPNLTLMYPAMAVGTLLLVLAYVASVRPVKREAR